MTATPDLLAVLEERFDAIRREAGSTRRKLAKGLAVNGATGLRNVENEAKDALADLRRHREGASA